MTISIILQTLKMVKQGDPISDDPQDCSGERINNAVRFLASEWSLLEPYRRLFLSTFWPVQIVDEKWFDYSPVGNHKMTIFIIGQFMSILWFQKGPCRDQREATTEKMNIL